MLGTAVPAAQSGCLQECALDVLMESLPGGALALAGSALGALGRGKRADPWSRLGACDGRRSCCSVIF